MTSVVPRPVAVSVPASGRWVRVTVVTPRGRADLALPADVAVAELVPMVREVVGGRPVSRRPEGWRFTGTSGVPLPPDATPDELSLRDGELLHLGPARPVPAPPVVDDAADAVAESVRSATGPGPLPVGAVGATLLVVAACGVLATVTGPLRPGAAVLAGAGALVALLVARRSGGNGAACCAVPPAATAGLLALPPTTGAPSAGALLLAAAAAGAVAATGLVLLRVLSPLLLAATLATSATALAALAALVLDAPAPAVAAGLAAPALAVGPLLPRIALRLAGVAAPAVPTGADDLAAAEHLPGAAELPARAELARGLLAGAVAGTALPAAGAAALAASGGGTAGAGLAAVTAAVLLLRARTHTEPLPAQALTGCALAGVAAAAVPAALAHGAEIRLAVAAGLGLATLVGAACVRATPSPPVRRALDVVELLLTAAAIPVALAAMGLFALVRGL
ncbi:type VII secretion integral membrane protein EccD [Pseudonocardia phyllosphaerae]|uniref:type VII secretion integral membrane protein EccD n=1 Tax=Pseudonocardia phyllosphaerae TaxID=3390502 RepID=UPI00397AA268